MTVHGSLTRRPVYTGNRRVPGLYERRLADGSIVYDAALRLGGKARRHRLEANTKTDAIAELRALQVDYARGETPPLGRDVAYRRGGRGGLAGPSREPRRPPRRPAALLRADGRALPAAARPPRRPGARPAAGRRRHGRRRAPARRPARPGRARPGDRHERDRHPLGAVPVRREGRARRAEPGARPRPRRPARARRA